MAVHIIGADCSLGEAVVDKLLGMDIDVIAAEESHFVRNEVMLRYSKSNLSKTGKGFSVSFDGSEADVVVGKDIIITDMIPIVQINGCHKKSNLGWKEMINIHNLATGLALLMLQLRLPKLQK